MMQRGCSSAGLCFVSIRCDKRVRHPDLVVCTVQDARSCRKLCQETVGCNAWLHCWHEGGCDDGVTSDRRRYPYNGCELLSLQHVSSCSSSLDTVSKVEACFWSYNDGA